MPNAELRLRLLEHILRLPEDRLDEVARLLAPPPATVAHTPEYWPHAPLHRISELGTYIVTAGTYLKEHHFRDPERLDFLQEELLRHLREGGWQVDAWAVFSNHYHFVAHRSEGCSSLDELTKLLHGTTSCFANELDGVTGRKVWHNYWDTKLTHETSYRARLHYVHANAVKHGLVRAAADYPWCSAGWFERTSSPAQVRTIYSFKIDRVNVMDDFDPLGPWSASLQRRFVSLCG